MAAHSFHTVCVYDEEYFTEKIRLYKAFEYAIDSMEVHSLQGRSLFYINHAE